MFNKIVFAFFCVLHLTSGVHAQQELYLYQSPDIFQSTALNPAFTHTKKLAIGLPGLLVDAYHSGDIRYSDVFATENGHRVIDFGSLINKLDPENEVNYRQSIETFRVGFNLPTAGIAIFAGHSIHIAGMGTYPKSLAQILWQGNAQFIDSTVQIGPGANLSVWNELSAGASKKMGRFTVGARLKYLSGAAAVKTDKHFASIHTDGDIYQLTLNTDYEFHSAAVVSAIDTIGLGYDIDLQKIKYGQLFSKNSGFALDLGVQAKLNEKLTISASVVDLGAKIKWKENANRFNSQGAYTYSGLVLPGESLLNAGDSISLEGKLDTLNDIFNFHKTAETFTTKLPMRIFAGATYKITTKITGGVSFMLEEYDGNKTFAAGVNAQWSPLKWLTVGSLIATNSRKPFNMGLQLVLKPGPLQLFLISDNILNSVTPYASSDVNFRLGASLSFL